MRNPEFLSPKSHEDIEDIRYSRRGQFCGVGFFIDLLQGFLALSS